MSMSACRDSITPAQGWSSEPAVQRDVLVLLQCFTRVCSPHPTRVNAFQTIQVRSFDGTVLTLGNRAFTM